MVSFPCVDVVVQQRLMTVPARGNFATNRFQTHFCALYSVSDAKSDCSLNLFRIGISLFRISRDEPLPGIDSAGSNGGWERVHDE